VASAQSHQDVVALVKSELMAKGEELSGACGAFKIVIRVAWRLRHEGYGLLGGKTPGQNGCAINGDKYAADWLLKADGHGVDVLGDAGGQNAPTWREEEAEARFYRPAFDPGDSRTDSLPNTPPNLSVDLEPIYQALESLQKQIKEQVDVLNSRITNEAAERVEGDANVKEAVEALEKRLFAVEQRVIPSRCIAHFFGIRSTSCALQ
jgi:hypothetical protein